MPITHSAPTTTVVLEEDLVPVDFYHTGNDRYVFFDFQERVAKGSPMLKAGTMFMFTTVDVIGDPHQNAADVEPLLPSEHIFEPSAVCGIGTSSVRLQPMGKPGLWGTTGANLIFMTAWVAWIYYDPVNTKWTFSTWPRNGDAFRTIRRVLLPVP